MISTLMERVVLGLQGYTDEAYDRACREAAYEFRRTYFDETQTVGLALDAYDTDNEAILQVMAERYLQELRCAALKFATAKCLRAGAAVAALMVWTGKAQKHQFKAMHVLRPVAPDERRPPVPWQTFEVK